MRSKEGDSLCGRIAALYGDEGLAAQIYSSGKLRVLTNLLPLLHGGQIGKTTNLWPSQKMKLSPKIHLLHLKVKWKLIHLLDLMISNVLGVKELNILLLNVQIKEL